MTTLRGRCLLSFSICLWLAVGCHVDDEKIALWKTTENGPTKLAEAFADPSIEMDIRVKTAVALVEIKALDAVREALRKMDKADAQRVIAALAPKLGELSRGEGGGPDEKTLTKQQIDAKDGLFALLDFAGPETRASVEKPLVAWCVEGNYNIRAMAGYNIRAIVKKIGAPAAQALTGLLAADQVAIEPIAKLVREVKDPVALASASKRMAELLAGEVAKAAKGSAQQIQINETHLVAAAVIGGDEVAAVLLDLATNKLLGAELQRLALRAYSQAVESGHIQPDKAQVDRLFAMAESSDYDKYQREETYLTLSQCAGKDAAARFAALLKNDDFFWRLVGLRCLLRMDGEGQLAAALGAKNLASKAEEVDEIIGWVAKFPKLLPKVRELAKSGGPFARGISVNILALKGDKAADLPLLEELRADGTKLPKGFEHATVGEAANAAIERLANEKGH